MAESQIPIGLALGEAGLDVRFHRERRQTAAANARADREETRAQVAEARAAEAERRLAAIEASAAWKLTLPARRVANAVPKPIYGMLRSLPARLRRGPAGISEAGAPADPEWMQPDPAPRNAARALLIDNNWPRPDRDAGSIEIVNLAVGLRALGFQVVFAVDLSQADGDDGREALAGLGVRCIGLPDGASFRPFLEASGSGYTLVVLNRVYCGGHHMEVVRTYCTRARVVFNTIDLHHLRIAREAAVLGSQAGVAAAVATREREEWLAAEADATFVVSDAERDLLRTTVPGADVLVLPLARDVQPPQTPFSLRSGIGFIGGFAHSPNVDAVAFFLRDVWPIVVQREPACRFSIVGAGLAADILAEAPGKVEYLGAVTDIGPWFESLRLTIAPLRFGAGVKGKIVSSLAAGVPCVATTVAVEGMQLRDGVDILVADEPKALAERILQGYDDQRLWTRLSEAGLAHVGAQFSPDAWRATLVKALGAIGVLPLASE